MFPLTWNYIAEMIKDKCVKIQTWKNMQIVKKIVQFFNLCLFSSLLLSKAKDIYIEKANSYLLQLHKRPQKEENYQT